MTDSDSDLELSAEAIKALQEFYKEEHEKLVNELNNSSSEFEENWQLSQFWYNESTINILSNIATEFVQAGGKIALVSCPSLYKKIKETCKPATEVSGDTFIHLQPKPVTLFEYDRRFEVYGKDYIFYDYNTPLNLPAHLSGYFDLVIADPPFLSEECLEKTANTVRFLTKDKIILNTGEVMEETANKLLNVTKSSIQLKHTRNLANEIKCFTNFDVERLLTGNKNSF